MANLKATRSGNYVRKDGDHKGKTFFTYDITGSKEDMKKFTDSPNFKLYPRHSATGVPQIHTMYMDPLRKQNPLYQKQDGNFTLDQSETRDDLGVLQALREQAPELVAGFTAVVLEKSFGKASVATSMLAPEPAPVTGKGADLTDVS